MTAQSYASALRDYRKAIDDLRKPEAGAVERGAGGVSPHASDAALEQAVQRSEELRTVLSSAVAGKDTDLRDIAGLKLLAAAAYDLALAEELAMTGEAAGREVERSASAVFASPDLRAILDAPLDATAMRSLAVIERAAFPTKLDPARDKLRDMVDPFVKDITEKSIDSVSTAVTGALNFGLGPLQAGLSAVTQEILAKVPAGVFAFVRYAARLAREAVRKLWEAFGQSEQEKIKSDTEGWLKDLLQNKNPAVALLDSLYQSARLKEEVIAMIDSTKVTEVGPFKRAADALDDLSARYANIAKTLGWVMRAVGWIKTPLLGFTPWGPLAAYGVYGGVLGYSVYAGGDYLDAAWFDNKWLNHVVGLRAVIRGEIGS
jgi:hypothetical protein